MIEMFRRAILLLSLATLLAAPLWAQDNSVRVRLYAVHPPERLTLAGNDLRWKACEQCPATATEKLKVTAERGQLRVEGSPLPRPRVFVSGTYRLHAPGEQPISAAYALELRAQQERIVVIAAMPLEDYVSAVLAGESGNFEQLESMKAMAVAVRTYAARFRGRHAADGFDYCDTTHCQDLRLAVENPRTRTAEQATAGELLWYRGGLATTYYHQHCGGTSAAANEVWPTVGAPYLKSHPDPYCAARPLHWETTLTRAELEQALAASEVKIPAGWRTLAVTTRTQSGRAQRLRFSGPGGGTDVSASTLRFAVGRELGWNRIRSELYEVRMRDSDVTFTGAGAGHGVGLCQVGAEQMAAKGDSYREILAFYYPGTNVAKKSAIEWITRKSEHFDAQVMDTADAAVLDLAERLLGEVESATGWTPPRRPRIQVFPTLDAYRDTTGQPGWVAATTRGATIRLQPLATLRAR
ncbi:MAG: SpoIID/LytB domain-containing protein, partial [Acidobacteriota bacterium]|nr:SpoIID/LytB domain-containing protein [Acidobacteriota bacterium]